MDPLINHILVGYTSACIALIVIKINLIAILMQYYSNAPATLVKGASHLQTVKMEMAISKLLFSGEVPC